MKLTGLDFKLYSNCPFLFKEAKKGTKEVTFTDTEMRKQAKAEENEDNQDVKKEDVSNQGKTQHLRDVDIVNRLDQKQMAYVRLHYFMNISTKNLDHNFLFIQLNITRTVNYLNFKW